MSRPNLTERNRLRRERDKSRRKSRVVHKGQKATLNGKPVVADGKGNWVTQGERIGRGGSRRPGKTVGTYTPGQDRSKTNTRKKETAAQKEKRLFPETESQARTRIGSGSTSSSKGSKGSGGSTTPKSTPKPRTAPPKPRTAAPKKPAPVSGEGRAALRIPAPAASAPAKKPHIKSDRLRAALADTESMKRKKK